MSSSSSLPTKRPLEIIDVDAVAATPASAAESSSSSSPNSIIMISSSSPMSLSVSSSSSSSLPPPTAKRSCQQQQGKGENEQMEEGVPMDENHHQDDDEMNNNNDNVVVDDTSSSPIKVVQSNLTNPNIDYVHKRIDCGVYPFISTSTTNNNSTNNSKNNEQYCSKCYCVICDIPASDCKEWNIHCHQKEPIIRKSITTTTIDSDDDEEEHAYAMIQHSTTGHGLRRAGTASATAAAARSSFFQNYGNSGRGGGYGHVGRRELGGRRGGGYGRTTNLQYENDDNDNIFLDGLLPRGSSGEPKPSELKITDILAKNLKEIIEESDKSEWDKGFIIMEKESSSKPTITTKSNKSTTTGTTTTASDPTTSTSSNILPIVSQLSMDGDISSLSLYDSFLLNSIKIGWPFPTILQPQRLMGVHITTALKAKNHVVIESPTGTGKSAAILCSVLAWQRYHMQTIKYQTKGKKDLLDDDNNDPNSTSTTVPTIIYCSRTHSQVSQMVSSLKKTPYRPRMCVLGSRERMCINKSLKNNKGKGRKGLNQACRDRKLETDKQRKMAWKNPQLHYDDDNPTIPIREDLDDDVDDDDEDQDDDPEMEGLGGSTTRTNRSQKKKPTCPHYRQLSSRRTAELTKNRFVWNATQIKKASASASSSSCGCSNGDDGRGGGCTSGGGAATTVIGGGEQTTLGVGDLEDLVQFGKNPYRESNITLYRNKTTTTTITNDVGFGFALMDRPKRSGGGCQVEQVAPTSIAEQDGRLQVGDWVLSLNGILTRHWTMNQMANYIRSFTGSPLIVEVVRKDSDRNESIHDRTTNDKDDEEYSEHAICPYYLSRGLLPHVNLVFCPYNYVLDPAIRKSLGIDLAGSVVVLDEAHNVEDTLCESGSGEFSEFNLCHLASMLTSYANERTSSYAKENTGTMMELVGTREEKSVAEVAHELLLFVETLINYMRHERLKFENNSFGLQKLQKEHEGRYKLPDTHSVELKYYGPTGYGYKGEAIGCQSLLKELGITPEQCTQLSEYANSMENHIFGGNDNKTNNDEVDHAAKAVFEELISVTLRLEFAAKNPEHFYMSCNLKPNGNMDYAVGKPENEYAAIMGRQPWRKHPRPLPFVSPRSELHPNVPLPVCHHEPCRGIKNDKGMYVREGTAINHASYCNGERPRWECHLVLRLLSPGILMKDISDQCRTVILASGSLAPLKSLCAELHLYGPSKKEGVGSWTLSQTAPNALSPGPAQVPGTWSQQSQKSPIPPTLQSPPATSVKDRKKDGSSKELVGRLQVAPPPLEAHHVVDLPKQLFAVAIGNFPDGSKLTVSYNNYRHPAFFPKLGRAIATVVETIPYGGVLIFLPSYSFLNKCLKCWDPNAEENRWNGHSEHSSFDVWDRLVQSKGKVIVEATGNQEKFEAARNEYTKNIKEEGKCVLLAVFRGKMSEGISFNDNNARGVICVGLPYPNAKDRNIIAKKAYNDEQRKICHNHFLLSGGDWYTQQAYRAIGQALGRCIRHGADYGTVVLMDSRYCDDGSPNLDGGICRAHVSLPKWMRHHMRTLSMRASQGCGHNPVLGGYGGLKRELYSFFGQAPEHSKTVLEKWQSDSEKAKTQSNNFRHSFDPETGKWTRAAHHHNNKNSNNNDDGKVKREN